MVQKFLSKFYLFPLIFIFVSCATIKVPNYEVTVDAPEISSQIRILQISDFHSNDYGKNEEKLIEKIRMEKPDLILITGDLFEFTRKEKSLHNVELLLDGIKGLCPFYFVSGNHEYYEGHNNEYAYMISDAGGVVLDNAVAVEEIKGVRFVIAGVSDPIQNVPLEKRKRDTHDDEDFYTRLDVTTQKASEISGDMYILLSHRPEYIKKYKSYGLYDLILSGHAHGGQWRLPPLINGLYAPGGGLFPKYAGGRYDFKEKKSSTFIVSRGLSHQTPMFPRFFNPVELVEILVQTEAFGQ